MICGIKVVKYAVKLGSVFISVFYAPLLINRALDF